MAMRCSWLVAAVAPWPLLTAWLTFIGEVDPGYDQRGTKQQG